MIDQYRERGGRGRGRGREDCVAFPSANSSLVPLFKKARKDAIQTQYFPRLQRCHRDTTMKCDFMLRYDSYYDMIHLKFRQSPHPSKWGRKEIGNDYLKQGLSNATALYGPLYGCIMYNTEDRHSAVGCLKG